jgi:hypothetical protein
LSLNQNKICCVSPNQTLPNKLLATDESQKSKYPASKYSTKSAIGPGVGGSPVQLLKSKITIDRKQNANVFIKWLRVNGFLNIKNRI